MAIALTTAFTPSAFELEGSGISVESVGLRMGADKDCLVELDEEGEVVEEGV